MAQLAAEADGLAARARGFWEQRQYPQSAALYERLLARGEARAEANYCLGCLAALRGDDAGALRHLRASLAEDPARAAAYYMLGQVAERRKEAAEARAMYAEALRREPGHRDAQTRLSALGGAPPAGPGATGAPGEPARAHHPAPAAEIWAAAGGGQGPTIHIVNTINPTISASVPGSSAAAAPSAAQLPAAAPAAAAPTGGAVRHDDEHARGAGGIYDIVARDQSPLGRRTLHALKLIEGHTRLSARAFIGQPGFRGRYGFQSRNRHGVGAGQGDFQPAFDDGRGPIGFLFRLVFFPWVLVITPFLARATSLTIERGRLTLRYGLFRRSMVMVEVHWIGNVYYERTFWELLLGQATVYLVLDGGPHRGGALRLPGVVPAREVEEFVVRLRDASQMVRKGDYYAKAFIN